MPTVTAPRPVETLDPALVAQADQALQHELVAAQVVPPPVEQAPTAPHHRSWIGDLLTEKLWHHGDKQRREHEAARQAGDAQADYARIEAFLTQGRDVAVSTVKSHPWLLLTPGLLGATLAVKFARRSRPESAKEFTTAVSRRVGALAVNSAERGSQWLVDKVHDVDWWELAKWATENDEIRALAAASSAAGPYGRAASVAYGALQGAVAYHEAPQRGHSRMPAVFSAIVSHALHAKLKGKGDYVKGKAATEELLRRAAELRAIAARAN